MTFDIYKAVRDQALEENAGLIKVLGKENPGVIDDVIGLFRTVTPSILTGKRVGHLRVIEYGDLSVLGKLVGTQISTIHDSFSRILILPDPLLDLKLPNHIVDTKSLSKSELLVFSSIYFPDHFTRNTIVELFMREKDSYSQNLLLDLNSLYLEDIKEEEVSNVHNFGVSEKKLPFFERMKMLLNGESRRKFEYEYSFSKVRKRQGKYSDLYILRLLKSFLGYIGIRKSEVIKFPGEYKEQQNIDDSNTTVETKKLNPYSEEIIKGVFISIMIEIAHLPENIEWYVGARKEPFIDSESIKQLERMKEISVLGGFYNFHEQIESTLAMMISYYYPELVGKYGTKKAKTLKSPKLEKYPSIEEIDLNPESDKKISLLDQKNKLKDKTNEDDVIIFEMLDKVADHYGFSKPSLLKCNRQFIKYILSCPDDEIVAFKLEGKKIAITAKMFRRIFHRGTVPAKEDTNNVLKFKK